MSIVTTLQAGAYTGAVGNWCGQCGIGSIGSGVDSSMGEGLPLNSSIDALHASFAAVGTTPHSEHVYWWGLGAWFVCWLGVIMWCLAL